MKIIIAAMAFATAVAIANGVHAEPLDYGFGNGNLYGSSRTNNGARTYESPTFSSPSRSFGGDDVYVRGYTRDNGTYVQPHYRSAPDGNPYNNYSYGR